MAGDCKVSSWVFHQIAENECLDSVAENECQDSVE
jgi:hypothetical protein